LIFLFKDSLIKKKALVIIEVDEARGNPY